MAEDTPVSQVDALEDGPAEPTSGASACCGNHPSFDKTDAEVNLSPLVAVLQFTATADKENNFRICSELIRKARRRGVEMAFLPEGFDFLSENAAQSMSLSEPLTGPIITGYRKLAQELGIWLSLGGFHLKDERDKKSHNSHLVIDSAGNVVATYRKAHLCILSIPNKVTLDESLSSIPGTRILPPVQSPIGKIGLMCCYDLRFPEMASLLTRQGAEILAYPAAFTMQTGIAHWEPLLRARAIENQCYVIAAAQYGQHNQHRISYGHAMIVDPWGTILAQCQDGPGVAIAEINLERLHGIRRSMPVQSHRRHDLYRLSMGPVNYFDFTTESYKFGHVDIHHGKVFYETSLCVAFVNLKPVRPGHVLIIPKRSVEKFTSLTHEEISDLFETTQAVMKMLEKRYGAAASTIAVQDGHDAGQSVKHVHVHLIPRTPGDFDEDDIYKELESRDREKTRVVREAEDMEAEAREYKSLLYSAIGKI